MIGQSRKSGIDVLGSVLWGTNICQFYQTKEDLIEIVVTYFKAGLENNEYCLWITSQLVEVEYAKNSLKKSIPDFCTYLEKGQIEIIPCTNWFFNTGVPDLKKVSNSLFEKLNNALQNGFDGMRLGGTPFREEKEYWHSLSKLKEKTDKALIPYKMLNLCTYFHDRYNASETLEIVANYQFALLKREGKWKCIEFSNRKLPVEKLTSATNDWGLTFDAVPDLISILDTNFRIVRANKAMASRLGVTPEECVGLTCYRVIHGTDEAPAFCPNLQMLKDKLEHVEEVAVDSLCGDFIVSVSPLFDSDGQLTGCIHVARDITERKRAEEALRESEKRERAHSEELETVLDAVPVAVFISRDPQVLQITGNRLSYEWLQLPVGTNYSKSAAEGERPETFDLFKDGVKIPPEKMPSQLAATGTEVNNCELDIVFADGKIRHVLGNARPLRDEQGKIRGSISAFIDITERKKAEEALKQANDNLENLVKERTVELEQAYKSLKESEKGLSDAQRMAHIGNWEWNVLTDEAHWSDELYRIFKRSPQESAPNYAEYMNYVHPDDRDYVADACSEALKGKSYSIDHRIVLTSGEERIIHKQSEIIPDEGNNFVRINGIIQDITERKKAEKALKLSEERYRIITEQTGQLVYDYDVEIDTTDWAGNVEELTGFTNSEFRNMKLKFWLFLIHPEDLDRYLENFDKHMEAGDAYRMEYRFRKKNEEYIFIEDNGVCLREKNGKVHRILGVIKDITLKKKAEIFLANIEIARKKEIHHRIKNNLQVISSLLDLQSEKFRNRECVQDEEVIKAFRESQDRVTSIALIHEELHEGRGTDTLDFSPYLKKLVNSLFQTYRVGNSNISLKIVLEDNIFFDMDIAVPLGIIINELVSNSLKYAFSGRDNGLIQIKLCKENSPENQVKGLENRLDSGFVEGSNIGTRSGKKAYNITNFVLSVSDNGVGIPEHFNSENSGSLGLQLVMILVDQLEGEFELKRGSGTEFVIRFGVEEKQ